MSLKTMGFKITFITSFPQKCLEKAIPPQKSNSNKSIQAEININ